MFYVKLVQQYLIPNLDGNLDGSNSSLGQKQFEALMNELLRFEGFPYAWGGANPQTSFDCSGLVQWGFNSIGISLPRTAQQQFHATMRISQEEVGSGDLVFFSGTSNHARISHVGIIIDKTRMFDANSSGVGFSSWAMGYWGRHIAGFGRVIHTGH